MSVRVENGTKKLQNAAVNTKSGTFSSCFIVQISFISKQLTAFCVIFLYVWGLSELTLICQQVLMASCEHTKTLSFYSRADIVWT